MLFSRILKTIFREILYKDNLLYPRQLSNKKMRCRAREIYIFLLVALTIFLSAEGAPDDDTVEHGRFDIARKKHSLRDVDTVEISQQYLRQKAAMQRLLPDTPPLMLMNNYEDLEGMQENLLDIVNKDNNNNDTPGNWTPWSDWSQCTKPCGIGVETRTRSCGSRSSRFNTVAMSCDGAATEHRLCNLEDCRDAYDFRQVQCSQQDTKPFQSRHFKWVPYSGSDNSPCELKCMAEGYNFYHTFGTALDGTQCGNGKRDMCMGGKCIKVGCDLEFDSNRTEDACGVCGGDNSTCFHYKSVFDQLQTDTATDFDYNEVVKIPKGATHLRVKEYTKNYLALKEDDGKYIINGNWVVSWPGNFNTAGTTVIYTRTDDKEEFEIVGPTTKDLYIMVLFLGYQPLIEYEYWIPDSVRKSRNDEFAELNVEKSVMITDEDYYDQIAAAGLDIDAVILPTAADTTTTLPTTTTLVSTTTKKANKVQSTKSKSAYCTSCKKNISKKRQFCDSDFVIHVRVISKRRLQRGRFVRYMVEILKTYKSGFKLMRREYVWVPITCCSRLRPYRHYLIMGRKYKFDHSSERVIQDVDMTGHETRQFETRLVADFTDFWYPWRRSYEIRMSKITRNLNCKRYKYRGSPHKNNQILRRGT